MNITFLIGNGFDLNLGLSTRYSDFIKSYINNKANETELISYFKEVIKQDEELWSNAEEAFGQLTSKFKESGKNAEDFSACHEDFCENLSTYLTSQENRINFEIFKKMIAKSFAKALKGYTNYFREVEKNQIITAQEVYGGGLIYNFVNFNYTKTLKCCIDALRDQKDILGKRIYKNMAYNNELGKIINVHGTLEYDMVFGVSDTSQIAESSLFEEYGEEFIAQIIKSQTDSINKENTYKKTIELLTNSNFIYIYGMALGNTDKHWWKTICSIMESHTNMHLVIHRFDAQNSGLIRRKYTTFEKKVRENFLSFSDVEETKQTEIASRIHIDGSNIFDGLCDLVNNPENIIEKEPIII